MSFLRPLTRVCPVLCRNSAFSKFNRNFNFQLSPRNMSGYSVVQRGSLYSDDFRLYIQKDGKFISPFHDIPLWYDESKKLFNMVVEVPRWTSAKMEINLKEGLNPIKQDVKKGKVRFVANVYPFVGYIWNYGALPQTWEDPEHVDDSTKCKGDGDPIDVCEIGQRIKKRGEVVPVKVLGVLAMVDEGETDWKLIVIDNEDPLAEKLNDIDDVEKHMPGLLADTVRWFRVYKMPDGKPPNQFAFDGKPQNRDFALNVIKEVSEQWNKMMKADKDPEGLSRNCLSLQDGMGVKISEGTAEGLLSNAELKEDTPIPVEKEKWHFVKE